MSYPGQSARDRYSDKHGFYPRSFRGIDFWPEGLSRYKKHRYMNVNSSVLGLDATPDGNDYGGLPTGIINAIREVPFSQMNTTPLGAP